MADEEREEKKKVSVKEVAMAEGEDRDGGSGWESTNPEILALIFMKLPLKEMAGVVPQVCRSWRDVVRGPYCWSFIDVEDWCRRVNKPFRINTLLNDLLRRTCGYLRSLSAYRLSSDRTFANIAINARHLETLHIPLCDVRNAVAIKYADKFSRLTVLDISYCTNIESSGIAEVGRHCRSLVYFKRNMPPFLSNSVPPEDGEALAVASTMPNLKWLGMAFGRFGDAGLEAIFVGCLALTHLDISGCWNVMFYGDLLEHCEKIQEFMYPEFILDEEDDHDDDHEEFEDDIESEDN